MVFVSALIPPSQVGRRLWLYYGGQEGVNSTLSVCGGGAVARAEEADVAATNGVVHVVDAVLGLPAQNVYQKLQADPMMA